jgi:hypothetical protein
MGYTPAFDDIYMGTLYGKWPAAAVWATLLPLIDKNGRIDMSIQAIAGMTGWPLELLSEGIKQLSEPDPGSRTAAEQGRRLLPIDPARPWGWIAVNHGKYREKARKQMHDVRRQESGENAERMRERRETRRDPTRPDDTRSQTQTHTQTEEHTQRAREELSPKALADEAEHHVGFERIRKAYPPFAGRQNWVIAEHHCRTRIAQGSSWNDLFDAVKRYTKFVDSGGVSSTAHVLRPETFFSAADEPWRQEWTPPVAKPKAALKPAPFVAPPDDQEMGARIAQPGR